ncbi:YrhA family protein [Citrobacter portucalensis]|nr:YrhA family protein [Citrobacter portucalensis]
MNTNISVILQDLKSMMDYYKYETTPPISKRFIESLKNTNIETNVNPTLKILANETNNLIINQPDYLTFLEIMDGFEYNGLRVFSLSIPEPLVKNLFLVNEFYRNNDDYINPDLAERLVIGDDSTSLFTYDTKSCLFEIRDNIGTDNIFGTFKSFTELLNETLDTVR